MSGAQEGDHLRFTCDITLDSPCILWYCFIIECAGGVVRYVGAPQGHMGGEGTIYGSLPPSFQVTVYTPREPRPEWYEHAIVYQIFPDRFRRGPGWRDTVLPQIDKPRHGPTRTLVEDWDTPPVYNKDDEGHVISWDFYGGTLSGIIEELPHLHDLGFSAIYLNPIFEAASNHRYDTADYLKVDPMLGTEEDFRELCDKGRELGISIILDGVFNHTGCDSRYFNKYGNYPDLGAYQSEDSPYRSWYQIGDDGKTYCSWWGVSDLPDVNEDEPSYREFISGHDGVIRHWMRDGARGWRLDVADELPDSCIEGIKGAVVAEKPDGLLLGEVWEDASNKTAYGHLRRYLLGDELDSAMNYPFRNALIDYLLGFISASDIEEKLLTLQENYPRQALYEALNLMGSHDRARILSILGGSPDPASLSEQERYDFKLNDGQRSLAKGRLWLAALVQMCMPGVPCVYYGDEAGLEGLTDPCNRAGFPWGHEDRDCETIYLNAITLRRTLPFLVDGDFEPFACGDDIFGFWRKGTGEYEGQSVAVLVNRNLSEPRSATVPMRGTRVDDLVGGLPIMVEDGQATLQLHGLGSAVLYFRDDDGVAKPLERGAGILCHVTSLPGGRDGRGTLGDEAIHFIDQLADCGLSYWQVLPVNPTDQYGSPYAGVSAMAGNTNLLDVDEDELRKRFSRRDAHDEGFKAFCERNDAWLDPYCTYMAIHKQMKGIRWQDWPVGLRHYDVALTDDSRFSDDIEFQRFSQYEFELAWQRVHEHARERGVRIIGDMPMYVSSDSADVWAHPDLFNLDADGLASEQAGTPPDQFAEKGQLWGNPTYNWDVMRADGYSWWLDRMGRAFSLYDYVRLDHFLGFSAYYSVPEGATASEGRWLKGPGMDLFKTAHERFGSLPVIAEDLGSITPSVRALVAQGCFPGMDVLEFSGTDVREGYVPAPGKVAYTSTHDTSTLLGWCEKEFDVEGDDARTLADRLVCRVWDSDAQVVIMPIQDALALGDEARMNVPGVAGGNWTWQADAGEFEKSMPFLSKITEESYRG